MPKIKYKKLSPTAVSPTTAEGTPVGLDIYANETVRINGQTVKTVGTGLAFEVDKGYYLEIAERSGMSIKTPLSKKAGIIDPDYRGEVKVVFQNISDFPIDVIAGDKIAQLILRKMYTPTAVEVTEFKQEETVRGDKGFGSSDVVE